MRRLFLIVIILAIILTLIAVGLLVWNKWKTDSNQNVNNENVNVPLDSNTNTTNTTPADATERGNAVARGRAFAERYGSWEPTTVAASLESLQGFTTASLGSSLSSNHESEEAPETLRSVVSRVLSSSVVDWANDGSRAEIAFTLSRTEDRVTGTVEYYETLTLIVVRENDQWLINSAAWSPSRIQPTSNGG